MRGSRVCVVAVLVAVTAGGAASAALAATLTYSAAGANVAAIQGAVDLFRTDLGALNPNVVGSFGSGRREINWDGVPDAFAAPNNLPANFFNVNSPRGVVFSTPGTGFQVSATVASGTAVEFGNIDPSYPGFFAPFSPQRLFTALGSTVTDVTFFVPGASTPAGVSGFGAVFSNVDSASVTSIQLFNSSNVSMGTFFVPNVAGANETLSFLGVRFNAGERAFRVRLTSGNQVLSAGNTLSDLVVMDDFIYGEPVAGTTVATLLGVSAHHTARGVLVRWRTSAIGGVAGFNVFRSDDGRLAKLNKTLIPSSFAGTFAPHRYSWLDRAAPVHRVLRYRLQAVGLNGTRTWIGFARSTRP